jgi:hypothetical protein
MAKKRPMAHERIMAGVKALQQERTEQERQQREAVIAEFTGTDTEATLHAMAAEILEYRRVLLMMELAVVYAQAGAPFQTICMDDEWKPKPGRPEWLTRRWQGLPDKPSSLDGAAASQ